MTRGEAIIRIEDYAAYLHGKPEPTYQIEVALDMAISALREQEERSKGCEYCNAPFGTLLMVTIDQETGEGSLNIFLDCDGQSLRIYDNNPSNPQIDKTKIKCCPMCGRRLEEV